MCLVTQDLAIPAIISSLPEMARDLGPRGAFAAQMMIAMTALGYMCGGLASGWIFQRTGTRHGLLMSLAVIGSAGGVGVLVGQPSVLLASRFALGVAAACVSTTCFWTIAHVYEGDARAKALGIATAVNFAAGVLSTTLGGLITTRFGWHFAAIQYVAGACLSMVLVAIAIPQVKPAAPTDQHRRIFRLKQELPFLLLVMVIFVIFAAGGAQMPFLLEEDGLVVAATRALVLAVPTLFATLSSFSYGWLQQALGVRGVFAMTLCCMGAGLAIVAFGHAQWGDVIGACLMGTGLGLIGPHLYHSISERTDSSSRSYHLGLLSTFIFFGIFLNPFVFAMLSRGMGVRSAFEMSAVVLATIALWTLRRRGQGYDFERKHL